MLRLGDNQSWFETARAAHGFDSVDLPIPGSLHVGQAFGCSCAISERRHGSFLELAPSERADLDHAEALDAA